MDLGAVNYHILQGGVKPIELLMSLIQQELHDPQPADTVLVVGPQARARDEDLSQLPDKGSSPAPIFYLQYLRRQALIPGAPSQLAGSAEMVDRSRRPYPIAADDVSSMPSAALSVSLADGIQRLVSRLKGETIPIRTPHDLAEAIHRIDPHIARTTPPAQTATLKVETEPLKIKAPALPPAAERSVPEPRTTPIDVLAMLRDRVLEHGQSIPNHTCVETVERSRYKHTGEPVKSCDTILARRRQSGAPSRLRLATTDRLRFDVGLSIEREIYSWAGANKFEEGEIDEIVPHGAMGPSHPSCSASSSAGLRGSFSKVRIPSTAARCMNTRSRFPDRRVTSVSRLTKNG